MDTLVYLLKKIGSYVLVLLGLSILIFIIGRVIPGDPARLALGPRTPEEVVQNLREEMNLDEPMYVQYGLWLKGVVQGDLGESLMTRRPVKTDLKEFLPATLEIAIISALLMIFMGIFLGILATKYTNTPLDGLIRVVSYLGIVSPAFVWATVFILLFGFIWPILPTMGRLSMGMDAPATITGMYTLDALLAGNLSVAIDAFKHLLLPAIALALGGLAQAARITRSTMVDNSEKDYILAAKAYGVSEGKILFKYLLKPSLIPTVTVLALDIAALFGNAFLVELMFNYPGMSKYGINAMLNKDLNAISAVVLVLGLIFIIVNIIIDVLVSILDPRVKLMGR
jgi:peptide/nickel transport system permease protein